ncbi:YobI family P-loop NTPase [Pantoea agglomerans]|uniref:YobI family P-loop NTPase n=1 Tax=Enterobacter agglomerans TaxID=549 RepID=UPI0028965F51|nr:DNA-binding protein [Pantoea agglomerans]WNK42629.1 DNA-binding protein [Pantoea agglomerans]
MKYSEITSGRKDKAVTDNSTGQVYDALTPVIMKDARTEEYFTALDYAFSQNQVRNIAVTGPYGAGKSTVILSYLDKRKENDFISVSLADFSLSGKDQEPPKNAEIELSILQQILYKEDKSSLPDSRIDRIQKRDKKHIFGIFLSSLSILFPLFLFSLSVMPKKILSYFGADEKTLAYAENAFPERLVTGVILALIFLFFTVRVASKAGFFDKKLKLNKIAFLQASADVSAQESSSLLNNCLDEIVYFFSRSRSKVVVFEDLDRLGNSEIFVKLREINQIINNNIKNEPVRFIYACRDDIFLGSDVRTKFFDFILPVVPVLDSRNAYTHLRNKLKDFPARDNVLLKQTSLYISDMRSLKNIANEYNIFRRVVDENKNEAKIFSVIFYKNVYAQDYNLTDKKSGVLFSFIKDYRLGKLHEHYFNSLDEKKAELEEKSQRLEKETASSAADVRKEIICRYISEAMWSDVYFSKSEHIRHNTVTFTSESLYKDEDSFLSFFCNGSIVFIGYNHNERGYNSFKAFQVDISNVTEEYKKRSQLVRSDRRKEYQKTVSHLNDVNEKIRIRNSITLADLTLFIGERKFTEIAESYIEKCISPDILDVKQLETLRTGFLRGGFEVLYYLLTNGYIMQDYMMFRSIFQEGTISVNDNDYIKAVGRFTGCKAVNDSFSLDSEKEVISELAEQHYIYREGALHHQIVTYLMKIHTTKNSGYLAVMISKLFENKAHEVLSVFEVLASRFIYGESFKDFIICALEKNGYLDRMLSFLQSSEPAPVQINIIINMIAFVKPATSDNKVNYRKFVEEQGYGLISRLDENTLQPFMDNIRELGVIYSDVELPGSDTEARALNYIAEHRMYRFDKANFRTVVAGLLAKDNVTCEDVDARPLSLVTDNDLSQVKSRIDSNSDVFVRDMLIGSDESSSVIVNMLLHAPLSDETKTEILEQMQFTVPDLKPFGDDFLNTDEGLSWRDLFFLHDHVEPHWTSLLEYLQQECDQAVLSGYIERHAEALGMQQVALTGDADEKLFYERIICDDDLSDAAYKAVLPALPVNTDLWDQNLSSGNVRRMIFSNKLTLGTGSFSKVTERLGTLTNGALCKTLLFWFTQFREEFLTDAEYYLNSDNDQTYHECMLASVCRSAEFTAAEKAGLVLNGYENYSEDALDNLGLSAEVIKNMIRNADSDDLKISLILRLLKTGNPTRNDMSALVNVLSEKEYRKVFSQKTATLTLKSSSKAEALLGALQGSGFITSWSVKSEGKYFVTCSRTYSEEDE